LFAARILQLQREQDPTFPPDCNAPLRDAQSRVNGAGDALCEAGESPNACRVRNYDTPPHLTTLNTECNPDDENCLTAKWLPPCADGTDTCDEPEAVCQDGTRPMAHMDPSAESNNRWVLYLGGEGGPCSDVKCWLHYRYGGALGDVGFPRAMSTLHPDHLYTNTKVGFGATNGEVNGPIDNPLATYNRVRFNRCSDASSDGVETVDLFDEEQTILGSAPVYHRGYPVWRSLLHSLTTTDGRDLDEDGTPDMPSLADATHVLLIGSSDATRWMTLAIDALAEELHAIAGPDVDIRYVIDGYFDTMLDNEGRYAPDAASDFNMYTHPYSTTSYCQLPDDGDGEDNESCSDHNLKENVRPDGRTSTRGELTARGSLLDASCEAHHGAAAPECFSSMHTLLHHVSTPWMVIADQEDPLVSKKSPVHAHTVYGFVNANDWRQRILGQARDTRELWLTSARHDGPGNAGDGVFVLRKNRRQNQPWNPTTSMHTHLHVDEAMKVGMTLCDADRNPLASANLPNLIHGWLEGVLPSFYMVEDGASWDGNSDYYVSGDHLAAGICPTPE
jgi:hypothetical protein